MTVRVEMGSTEQQIESIDPKRLSHTIEQAREYLLREYKINNLSTLELIDLKKIAEECLRQKTRVDQELIEMTRELADKERVGIKDDELYKRSRRIYSVSFESPSREAAVRWLLEVYDIDFRDIPKVNRIIDKTGNVLYQETAENLRQFEPSITDDEHTSIRKNDQLRHKLMTAKENLLARLESLSKTESDVVLETFEIPEDFFDYIKILREKSHLP